jgi:hypothetical protein
MYEHSFQLFWILYASNEAPILSFYIDNRSEYDEARSFRTG